MNVSGIPIKAFVLSACLLLVASVLLLYFHIHQAVDPGFSAYAKDTALIGLQIEALDRSVKELEQILPMVQNQLDSLKDVRNRAKDIGLINSIDRVRISIKQGFDSKKQELMKTADSLSVLSKMVY